MTRYKYNPEPPRVWTRVQDRCTYLSERDFKDEIYVPVLKKTIPRAQAIEELKMIQKGNVLQYKKNSSQLTKAQRYSQICKGKWTNRTVSFASQSETYTNPNTRSLKRVNYVDVPLNTIPGQPNNPSGPYQFGVINPFLCNSTSIQDGGQLVCNEVVEPCSGKIIRKTNKELCFPTSASDVPGKPMNLCWSNRIQTWFPRSKTTMNNSGTKWPSNYKGFVSACKIEIDINGEAINIIDEMIENIINNIDAAELTDPVTLMFASEDPTPVNNDNLNAVPSSNPVSTSSSSSAARSSLLFSLLLLYNYYLSTLNDDTNDTNDTNGNTNTNTVGNELLSTVLNDLYQDVGQDITNLMDTFSQGNNEQLANDLTFDVYQQLSVDLLQNSYPDSLSYTNFLSIIGSSLEGLYKANIQQQNNSLTIQNLNNTIKNLLLKNKNNLTAMEQESDMGVSASIRPEIVIYIKKYGMPKGGVFETEKLAEIVNNMKNE